MRSPKTLPYKLAKTFFLQMPFASGNCIYHARLAATSGTGMRPRCPTSSTCVKTPALGPVLDYGKVPPDLKAGDQGLYFRRGSGKSRPRGLGIFFPTKLVCRVFSSLIRFNALEKKKSGVAKPNKLKKLKRNTKTSTTRSTGYTVQNELVREKLEHLRKTYFSSEMLQSYINFRVPNLRVE